MDEESQKIQNCSGLRSQGLSDLKLRYEGIIQDLRNRIIKLENKNRNYFSHITLD